MLDGGRVSISAETSVQLNSSCLCGRPKGLRCHQRDSVDAVFSAVRDGSHITVAKPTGSGKSIEIKALIRRLFREDYRVLVAAPFTHLVKEFRRLDPIAIDGQIFDDPVPLYEEDVESFVEDGSFAGYKLATHARLSRTDASRIKKGKAKGTVIVIDEAQYAEAPGLQKFIEYAEAAGAQLVFFSATPSRPDGKIIWERYPNMRLFYRSLAEHMQVDEADGIRWAPAKLESAIQTYGAPAPVTAEEFDGFQVRDREALASAIYKRWKQTGRPKVVIHYPPSSSDEEVREAIKRKFKDRIYDASQGGGSKDGFDEVLQAEKERFQRGEPSKYDVIMGCHRVKVGSDWPFCTAVYSIGMPQTLPTVVQLVGRALRKKGEETPEEWCERAEICFFLPRSSGGSILKNLDSVHSWNTLVICTYMASIEVGQKLVLARSVKKALRKALGKKNQAEADSHASVIAVAADNPSKEDAAAQLTVLSLMEKAGSGLTVGELIKRVGRELTVPETQAVMEHLMSASKAKGPTAFNRLQEALEKTLTHEYSKLRKSKKIGLPFDKTTKDAYQAVLEQFRNETLQKSAVARSISDQVHAISGEQMQEVKTRIQGLEPFTVEQVKELAIRYKEDHGKWPTHASGVIGYDGETRTWQAVDGFFGSLSAFLQEHCGKSRSPTSLTVSQWKDLAFKYFQDHGRWPTYRSGAVWRRADYKFGSLNQFLIEHCGRKPSLLSMTDQLRGWAFRYLDEHGSWPTVQSGSIGYDGETRHWSALGSKSAFGSLDRFLREYCGKVDGPLWDREEMVRLVHQFYRDNSRWPSKNSGIIQHDKMKRTWSAMAKFARNHFGSWAGFLRDYCGKK